MLEKDSIVAIKIHKNKKVDDDLTVLKAREPSSHNPFFRLAIIGYEIQKTFGSLEHAIVYGERFKDGIVDTEKEQSAYLRNAQLELGDCFTQLQLLSMTYGWDIDETRELGLKHLAERHEDFKRKGWTEIK